MTSGVSWDSRSSVASFSAVSGTWSTDYPVTNLSDVRRSANVSRVTTAAGAASFSFQLPSAMTVQFIGLVRHNIAAGSVRIRLYSGAGLTTLVHDSGVVSVWPSGGPVSGYPSTRPYVLPAAVSVRSALIEFTDVGAAIEIGAVEIAKWWGWVGLAPGKETGFQTRAPVTDLLGAGAEPARGSTRRVLNGEISRLALAEAATVGLDFQISHGRGKPFVYVQDYEDATTWARSTWLATNTELPPSVGAIYRHDTFQFRFAEHLG